MRRRYEDILEEEQRLASNVQERNGRDLFPDIHDDGYDYDDDYEYLVESGLWEEEEY